MDNDSYKENTVKNLMLSALWMVENGYSVFANEGETAIQRKLIDTWGVQSWVRPRLDDGRYLALFRIKARGINYDIHCLHRIKIGDDIYEYWLMKVYAKSWADIKDHSVFLITRGKEITAPRQIIKKSDHFFDNYQIDSQHTLKLPTENLQILYDIEAWNFPKSYENSTINKHQIAIDENGKFKIIP
ncbi:MAG: hypothetical protein NTX45_25500 [Proteobacteria bacterium]|nr:hypothetical protein [Pseudomonadota bacterium]